MAPTSKLSAFLALAAASPHCDAFSFTPSPRLQQRQASVQLSASKQDENAVVDGLKKVSGGAAAFLTGMSIMAQVAFADPSAIAAIDESTVTQAQSSTVSSNVLLSIGAPSIGGGSSFDTLDFSLPSYDQVASSGDATRSSLDLSAAPKSDDGDAAANAAAKEDAKRAAAEEKAAQKQADADAKEAQKQADADAKEAAAKEADAKVAAKEAKVKAKAERLANEKEKQRLAVESQKASLESPANALKDIKVPDIQVPDIKVPSFSVPKVDMPKIDIPAPPKVDIPKPAATEFKIPDAPKFDLPKIDALKMPDMKAFSLPKVDIPAMPKIDTPKFDMPSAPAVPKISAPAAPKIDENLEPQEVRDARAAEKNAAFKNAQAEVKVCYNILCGHYCGVIQTYHTLILYLFSHI